MNEDFRNISEKIAAKFLQTVVFVDDQANYRGDDTILPTPGKLKSPPSLSPNLGMPQDKVALVSDEQTTSDIDIAEPENVGNIPHQSTLVQPSQNDDGNEIIQTTTTSDKWHELNAQDLIYAFSNAGLVCSVLKPNKDELAQISETVTSVAKNADLLVLDWVLYDQRGTATIQIIQDLIDFDQKHDGRLRLIVVYTGEKDLRSIARIISERVSTEIINDDTGCSMQLENCRITVYAKEEVSLTSDLASRKLSVEHLPKTLVSEFSQLTSGLVSNLALESLATLRLNTYALLTKLNSDIDIPFLTHRALLPRPDDSAEHLVDIIVSEIRFLLDEFEVTQSISFEKIKKWIESKEIDENLSTNLKLGKSSSLFTITKQEILELLEKGVDIWVKPIPQDRISGKNKTRMHEHITKILCQCDNVSPENLDAEFAMLTALGKTYSHVRKQNPQQKLILGVILEEMPGQDNDSSTQDDTICTPSKYWLCIQPRCDSVRISELERAFPLLPLEVVADGKNFDIVVKDSSGKSVKLKLSRKSYELKMERFSVNSTSDGAVIADLESNYLIFISTSNIKYKWLADLKREHAQRIINLFSSQLARVGLDESEWLRRWTR